ncbi:L-ornithine 5-monooxygenase [Clavulina sp. PMI_390]|nr:L-ornithine 5-monooxygenase [Clavulina sp. PMI_390]
MIQCPVEGEIFDVFTIGFGPAGLAIAVAIHDHPEGKTLKTHHIESHPQFSWHPGMLIPGYTMQVSFLKDLATVRDPTSKFTFLNFLKSTGRLIDFFNLYTWLPLRTEMDQYMRWCASHFANETEYSCVGLSVEPYFPPGSDGQTINILKVTYKNTLTGEIHSALTRNVVIATGAQPRIPADFPQDHPRVIHSSNYLFTKIPADVKSIGVIGAGQSASEIFKHTTTLFPQAETNLILRKTAVRPADISPFLNEKYNPEGVDYYFNLSEENRKSLLNEMQITAVGILHPNLVNDLYRMKYIDQAYGGHGKHDILPNMNVTKVEADDDKVTVTMTSAITGETTVKEYEYFFNGLGYIRKTQVTLLEDHLSKQLFPLSLRRDYSAHNYDPNFKAGIYLQGQAEGSHGISDGALSVLSVRGWEVVESILKRKNGGNWAPDERHNRVQLESRSDGLVWGF